MLGQDGGNRAGSTAPPGGVRGASLPPAPLPTAQRATRDVCLESDNTGCSSGTGGGGWDASATSTPDPPAAQNPEPLINGSGKRKPGKTPSTCTRGRQSPRLSALLPHTYFLRSNTVILFPTGLMTEFPSHVKFKLPHRYTVPSKFENWKENRVSTPEKS